ncbi:MAG: hypothetical protein P8188_03165 [Gemmatimonadota bacterium]
MSGGWRKIRGALGIGLSWAFAWFSAGMALLLVVGPDAADVPFPLGFGFLGFLAGVTFSGVLGLTEGRRRFDEMSLPRFALWGGVGGILLSVVFSLLAGLDLDLLMVLGPVFGLAGAGCAAGTLGLARMADDPELLDARAEVDQVGLTESERRELLGGG